MSNEPRKTTILQQELKEKLLHYLDAPCILPTAIEGLHLVRREEGGTPEQCFEKPLVGLVVQGTKHSFMAGQQYVYAEGQSVVAGVDMPIASYVENPSHEHPFLFVYLYLDKKLLSSLAMEMKNALPPRDEESPGVSVADADTDISEMFLRLVTLLEKPEQIPFRAPMMLKELHYLLLISPHGNLLRQLNTPGTQNNQIVQAINWIRENYKTPLRVDALARQVNMSASNLHRHFKLLTGAQPSAVSETAAALRSAETHAHRARTRFQCGAQRGIRKRDAVQQRIQAGVRRAASSGHEPKKNLIRPVLIENSSTIQKRPLPGRFLRTQRLLLLEMPTEERTKRTCFSRLPSVGMLQSFCSFPVGNPTRSCLSAALPPGIHEITCILFSESPEPGENLPPAGAEGGLRPRQEEESAIGQP